MIKKNKLTTQRGAVFEAFGFKKGDHPNHLWYPVDYGYHQMGFLFRDVLQRFRLAGTVYLWAGAGVFGKRAL